MPLGRHALVGKHGGLYYKRPRNPQGIEGAGKSVSTMFSFL